MLKLQTLTQIMYIKPIKITHLTKKTYEELQIKNYRDCRGYGAEHEHIISAVNYAIILRTLVLC